MTDQLKELRALVDYALERGITVGEARIRKMEFHRKVGPETVQALLSGLDAARAEGRRSPGDPALEAGCLPERLTDQCADAWPRPHSHDMLAWLAERPSLELDYGFDAEEEDMFWRVHERSGNINDREWDLIGQGSTPLAALLSAKSYMESTNAEQPE